MILRYVNQIIGCSSLTKNDLQIRKEFCLMKVLNLILASIVLFLGFIFDWDEHELRQSSNNLSTMDPLAMSNHEFFVAGADQSSRFVDEIIKGSVFSEGRLGNVGDAVSETTIFIDGVHTPVELVGTIGSGKESTAAFSLGGKEVLWLGENERLGNWQIDDIKQQVVRLSNLDEKLVLQQRKGTDRPTSQETSETDASGTNGTLTN